MCGSGAPSPTPTRQVAVLLVLDFQPGRLLRLLRVGEPKVASARTQGMHRLTPASRFKLVKYELDLLTILRFPTPPLGCSS